MKIPKISLIAVVFFANCCALSTAQRDSSHENHNHHHVHHSSISSTEATTKESVPSTSLDVKDMAASENYNTSSLDADDSDMNHHNHEGMDHRNHEEMGHRNHEEMGHHNHEDMGHHSHEDMSHDHHENKSYHNHEDMDKKKVSQPPDDHKMDHDSHGMLHDQAPSEDKGSSKVQMYPKHGHMDHDKMKTEDMDGMTHMHMPMPMNGSDMHGMMKMWFHTGIDETVLFEQWKIKSDVGMICSMIGIVLLAMFYEGLKFFREYLFKKYFSSIQFSTVAVTGESGHVSQLHKVQKNRMLSLSHAIQTCLHMVQIIISYFLMLIFMTYNVWLCLSVVIGAGLGYFIFGWKKATVVDITEHCH